MAGPHVFDPHVEAAHAWLRQFMIELALAPHDQARALHAMRAGLHAVRARLPAAEVVDLAAQLPTLIRGIYYDGWRLAQDPTQIRDRAAMLARVRCELGNERTLSAYDVLRATIRVLVAHVSPGEIADVVATLPRPVAELWRELGSPEPTAPAAPPPTRHTGYTR